MSSSEVTIEFILNIETNPRKEVYEEGVGVDPIMKRPFRMARFHALEIEMVEEIDIGRRTHSQKPRIYSRVTSKEYTWHANNERRSGVYTVTGIDSCVYNPGSSWMFVGPLLNFRTDYLLPRALQIPEGLRQEEKRGGREWLEAVHQDIEITAVQGGVFGDFDGPDALRQYWRVRNDWR